MLKTDFFIHVISQSLNKRGICICWNINRLGFAGWYLDCYRSTKQKHWHSDPLQDCTVDTVQKALALGVTMLLRSLALCRKNITKYVFPAKKHKYKSCLMLLLSVHYTEYDSILNARKWKEQLK